MQKLIDNCEQARESGSLKTKTVEVLFAEAPTSCEWSSGGNIAPEQGLITARREQYVSVPLSETETVCNLKFQVPSQEIVYDDNLIFTANTFVIAGTVKDIIEALPVTNSNGLALYSYNWDSLISTPAYFSPSDSALERQFCLGKKEGISTCEIPPTETYGVIKMEINQEAIQNILALTWINKIDVGLITTGDDDTYYDCRHKPVLMQLLVDYYTE